MKKILLFLFFSLIAQCCIAQKEANIWYFGVNAGLDFNGGAPVPIDDGQINTAEGCASIADPLTGQILLYTDGITVWDRNHDPMPASITTPLKGDPSSTQSGVIVPKPGSTNIYYIFTTAAQAGMGGLSGAAMCYSIVDLNLNGGDGDVATVNVELIDTSTEKIAVVGNCNRTEYWVVGHKWNCDSFYAFKLTAAGLSAPVKSAVGAIHEQEGIIGGGNTESIGYMKFSPDGKKLGLVNWIMSNLVEIFDFDFSTGIISNPITDYLEGAGDFFSGPYGCSFSPDNSKFYVSYISGNSLIYQYNMEAGTAADILASRTIVADMTGSMVGALQNGPDGKMYVATISAMPQTIDVINNPNALGSACNYVSNAVSIAPNTSTLGLPDMVESFLSVTALPLFTVPGQRAICKGDTVFASQAMPSTFTIIPDSGFYVNADSSMVTFFPSITTEYTVINSGDCGANDTVTFTIAVAPGPTADFSFNPAQPTTDQANILLRNESINAVSYEWYNAEKLLLANTTNHTINNPGEGKFCYMLIAFDTFQCKDTLEKCVTIIPGIGPSTVFIPNTFSPNGDGLNDDFKIQGINIEMLHFSIFNRYGERVFFTTDITRGWNGRYKDVLCEVGTYFYVVDYREARGQEKTLKSDLQLIR